MTIFPFVLHLLSFICKRMTLTALTLLFASALCLLFVHHRPWVHHNDNISFCASSFVFHLLKLDSDRTNSFVASALCLLFVHHITARECIMIIKFPFVLHLLSFICRSLTLTALTLLFASALCLLCPSQHVSVHQDNISFCASSFVFYLQEFDSDRTNSSLCLCFVSPLSITGCECASW